MQLDKVAPLSCVLTNMLSAEQQKLPPGDWEAELDEETFDLVLFKVGASDEDENRIVEPEALDWHESLWEHKTAGELFLKVESAHAQSLGTLLSQNDPGEIIVRAGVSAAEYKLKVWAFVRAKHYNQKLFWDITGCYELLGMTSHQGYVNSRKPLPNDSLKIGSLILDEHTAGVITLANELLNLLVCIGGIVVLWGVLLVLLYLRLKYKH